MDAKYIWWDLKDIPGFAATIATEGSDNLRMKLHLDGRKESLVLERVDGREGHDHGGGGWNFSHVCPPDCP